MSWDKKPLGAVCIKIGSGVTPRGGDAVYSDQGASLIRSQNVHNAKFQRDGLVFVNDDIAKKMAGVTVAENDVLLNITGDSVARCCLAPGDVLPARVNQHVLIIRPDASKLSPLFLAKYLVSPFMQATLLSWAGNGGTRKALTKGMIEALEMPLPDLPTQQRTAGILAAYDDLIENNRRRIGLLEQAARLLYREWFVHLRFPGHETAKIVDGLPEGWQKHLLGQVAEFNLGKMLDQNKNKGDSLPYLANVNVRWGDFELSDLRVMRFEERELERFGLCNGDIVMCEGGEPGRCAIWRDQLPHMMFQKALHRIRPLNGMNSEYLYRTLSYQAKRGHLSGLFTGSTIKHLPKEKLALVTIIVPPQDILAEFERIVMPMSHQTAELAKQNAKLARARDLLLPRLMDGRIPV